jgi:putative ATPase
LDQVLAYKKQRGNRRSKIDSGDDAVRLALQLGATDRPGADPRFIARRLCILASEDVGIADPQAMVQAAAAAQIVHLIGMPEGLFLLSQATIYLATAPKSNAVKNAYGATSSDAAAASREPVALHLRNAVTPLMKSIGYGQGYRYVHNDPQARAEMPCLPESLRGRVYYERGNVDENPLDCPREHT